MSVKGWIEANNYKGGIIRYLYDKITAMDSGDSTIATKVSDLETAVGGSNSGLTKDVADIQTAIGDEDTADSILGRIKALEDK